MHEQKTWHRRLIFERTNRQEEMGLLRCTPHAVHPARKRTAAARMVKREGLQMVLNQNGTMRKKLSHNTFELVELKFVGVKWIWTRLPSGIRIVFAIWRRHQKDALRMQQAPAFG